MEKVISGVKGRWREILKLNLTESCDRHSLIAGDYPFVDGGYHSSYFTVHHSSVKLWDDLCQGLVDAVCDGCSNSGSCMERGGWGCLLGVGHLLFLLFCLGFLEGWASLEGGGMGSLAVGALELGGVIFLFACRVAMGSSAVLAGVWLGAFSCHVPKGLAFEALAGSFTQVVDHTELSEIKKEKTSF